MAVDLKLTKDPATGLFDLTIKNGDFALVDSFDTSIIVSLFSDQRADASEVPASESRRGWWGDQFGDDPTFRSGSKLWLLDQARNTQETLNSAIDFSSDSLQWFIDENHIENIEITGESTSTGITLKEIFFRDQSRVDTKFFDLWENSGAV